MSPEGDPGWVGPVVKVMALDATSSPEVVCVVRLRDGRAVAHPDSFPEWETEGVLGRSQSGRVFPGDGQRFLDELPYAYRSAYLWAEPAQS